MKNLIIGLLASLFISVSVADAQNISEYKSKIAHRTVNGGSVLIREDEGVDLAVSQAEARSQTSVMGYRVVIYMGNSGNARNEAIAARDQYMSIFPGSRCVLSYENPYFKVTVGSCISQEEAVLLMQRVQGNFPKSFVTRESIPLSDFTRQATPDGQPESN